MSSSPGTPVPSPQSGIYDISDQARIDAIVAFEFSFSEMEKLALETLARTGRDPFYCFELSMSMMRLRRKVNDLRFKSKQPPLPSGVKT
jgi:hypothetical protein